MSNISKIKNNVKKISEIKNHLLYNKLYKINSNMVIIS